ncbi:MAG TPA: carbamate kinase [Candidatus Marinimicrobia bacterium]|nr:carbamate kinase [Candidatus Neomarinimicrobiota bacterium]
MENKRTAVVALGGNALSPDGKSDISAEFANTRKSMAAMMSFIENGYNLAITYGNGPQVGNALLRVEMARGKVPEAPLGVLVADTQGSIGYMIEQSLQNQLIKSGIQRNVITLVTQVLIDINDPACSNPTKYVGQFFSKDEIAPLAKANDWHIKEVPGRGWRRVVPSPKPIGIVNHEAVRSLLKGGNIVITAGGGGIPVYYNHHKLYEGFDAVIDKDLASAVLAKEIGASELFILTNVDKVCLNFGKTNEKPLSKLTVAEAETYLSAGEFPAGSMGPKIAGAIEFLKAGGEKVIISSVEKVGEAIQGLNGTVITRYKITKSINL